MPCREVGTANPEISGLGILIAFGIQAGISLILSIISFTLRDAATHDQRKLLKGGFSKKSTKERWGEKHVTMIALKNPKAFLKDRLSNYKASGVEESEEGLDDEEKRRRAKRRIIDRILAGASDVQTLNGIALLIAALIQWKTLDLYHFHIVYDTASFVGVSFVAALTNVFGHDDERRITRYISIVIFGVLFLVFTILFGISLNNWDDEVPGHCYNARGIAAPGSDHPTVDAIYIGITCFYMLSTLGGAMEYSIGTAKENVFRRFIIIQLSAMQYPVHLYMIITMRESNADLLKGDSENEWGFAQIVALVLLASTLVECIRGARDIRLISRAPHLGNDLEEGESRPSLSHQVSDGSSSVQKHATAIASLSNDATKKD